VELGPATEKEKNRATPGVDLSSYVLTLEHLGYFEKYLNIKINLQQGLF